MSDNMQNDQFKPRIDIRALRTNGHLRIEVEDNGPGVPTEIRNRIFEPFFTTKPTGIGTGLGLSVSYFIITNGHGGRLLLEQEDGFGAKFVIMLPVADQKTGEAGQSAECFDKELVQ